MGPGDRNLPMSEISGYQPVSRIGEVVMNAFGIRGLLSWNTAAVSPSVCPA